MEHFFRSELCDVQLQQLICLVTFSCTSRLCCMCIFPFLLVALARSVQPVQRLSILSFLVVSGCILLRVLDG